MSRRGENFSVSSGPFVLNSSLLDQVVCFYMGGEQNARERFVFRAAVSSLVERRIRHGKERA